MGVSFGHHVGSRAGTKPRDKSPHLLSHPPSPVTFKISTHCVWGHMLVIQVLEGGAKAGGSLL